MDKKIVKYFGFISMFLCLVITANNKTYAMSLTAERTGLFGSYETMSRQLVAFKKWNGVLDRIKKDREKEPVPKTICRKTVQQKCYRQAWHELLDFLKDKPAERQIAEINTHMNKAPYINDIINWGIPDYWASVRQFFKKDGDCEDYAIAKYMSLKELGFDADKMRIVVVQDTNLDVPHAVLVVSLNGDRLVLDNQISYVVKEKAVLHYRPFYSINENAWWLHRM
ncbi:MAG: transglutaminase-like cysteine peptidase [Emcibacter sp.]|nr:transglutaminase-like cysteine peptidase [Emcibacter sp.]